MSSITPYLLFLSFRPRQYIKVFRKCILQIILQNFSQMNTTNDRNKLEEIKHLLMPIIEIIYFYFLFTC